MKPIFVRTISGLIYAAVLIGCILWCKYSFLALMLFFAATLTYEFLRLTMGREYFFSQILTMVTSATFVALIWAVRTFPSLPAEFAFLILFPILVIMVNSLYVRDKTDFGKFANIYASFVYIALPVSMFNYLVIDGDGNYNGLILVLFMVLVWMSDVGAYVFGMSFGQKYGKKLFESISPKKSWIGFWGGMFVAILVSLIFCFTGVWKIAGAEYISWYHSIILAVLMNIAGVYGDLFESQWKRHYAVKDSGKLIPGHGGLLDRLDSTLFAVPVGMLYINLLLYIIS